MNELALFDAPADAPMSDADFEAWREAKAARIELVQATAVLEVAAHLAEVHRQHVYRRDEGGFQGWIEERLSMSRRTAYNLLDVHKQFGSESVQILHTLPRSVLYLLAPESVPGEARAEVIQRAEAGETLTKAQVTEIVDKAVIASRADVEAQLRRVREDADRRVAEVHAEYENKMFFDPIELKAEIEKVVAPLHQQIADYEAKLEKIRKKEQERIDKDRAERSAKAKTEERGPGIDSQMSLNETIARRELRSFVTAAMQIPPSKMLEIARQSAEATEQSVAQWLGDSPSQARTAAVWLSEFLALTEDGR